MNDINFNIGSVNPSGISDTVFLVPKRHIKRWPTISNDLDTIMQGHYAEYQGDFELHPGRHWNRFYSTQGKGSVKWEYIGETDCKMVTNLASLSYPKLTDEIRAFAKYASNGDFVFIVRHDAKYYVVGSPDYRATLTPNGDSGDTPGSAKGVSLDITCPDTTPLPTYHGTLALADGILDCRTSTFINYEDMNTNKLQDYTNLIQGGNTVRFDALGKEGRIHLEGSGSIKVEVSVDGVSYKEVEHGVEFQNGVAIAPVSFYIGDKVRISASSLTKVKINYNNIKTN